MRTVWASLGSKKGLGGEQAATEKSRKMTSKGPEKDREKGRVQETPKKSRKKSRKMTSEGLGNERENAQKSGKQQKRSEF